MKRILAILLMIAFVCVPAFGQTKVVKATMQGGATATGNGTALNVSQVGAAGFQVTGTFVGTITFEGTIDGTNWVSIQVEDVAAGTISSTATAAGIYVSRTAGILLVRARVSAYTSGSITVIGVGTSAPGALNVAPASDATAANQVLGNTSLSTIAGDTTSLDGKVTACDTSALSTSAKQLADGHNITVDNAAAGAAVNVQDGGNTLTVDGAVTANAGTNLNTSALATSAKQLGDGHNVTIDNAAAGAAVNIQDGGNAITVDGTVTANAGTNLNTSALSTSAKQLADGHNVTIDNAVAGAAVNVQDGGNSLTVDGSVAITTAEHNIVILTQAVATPGTGEAFAGSQQVIYFFIEARRVDGVNTSNVYVGTSAVDKDASQQNVMAPGDKWEWTAPPGVTADLDAFYVDAITATDGITGFYIAAP